MIDTIRPAESTVHIHPASLAAARRYIAAIVARDPLHERLGPDWAEIEVDRLLARFVDRYAAVATGPYSKRGPDALRIALSSI